MDQFDRLNGEAPRPEALRKGQPDPPDVTVPPHRDAVKLLELVAMNICAVTDDLEGGDYEGAYRSAWQADDLLADVREVLGCSARVRRTA